MVKLYYTPTSCGAASFIAAVAAQVPLQTEQVDIREHKTASGANFYDINSKGNVPALVLDDGTVLNENVAVLQYIADLNPGKVAGVNGSLERAVLQNILAYLASEVHPSIGGLFNPTIGEEVKQYLRGNASKKLAYLDLHVLNGGKRFLVGDSFTIADSYLYIILTWTAYVGIDISAFKNVASYFEGISGLDVVKAGHARIATSPSSTL